MSHPILRSLIATALFCAATPAYAYTPLTLRHQHHLFTLNPNIHPEWSTVHDEWLYKGTQMRPPAAFRVDGDRIPAVPAGWEKRSVQGWDTDAIAKTVNDLLSTDFYRDAGSVVIDRHEDGEIIFEGVGLTGRRVDLDKAADLIVAALESDISDVVLPVIYEQPVITIKDPDLKKSGITEVVTVGESDYHGSPLARRHNIAVGLSKFNGHIIEDGETFSFNEVLGPVNASTGFKQELVILGERTLPDYGGGLCQVSTTAYRGVWEYGFPIDQRRNHSYAVSYYFPHGTDATIYPPHTDMKFTNDSGYPLLIQTYTEGDKAYFIYYGTHDDRQSEIVGPYVWGRTNPPPDRVEYTTEIPEGTTRIVGKPVPGVRANWYRVVQMPEEEESMESFYSHYEARPLFTQYGAASEEVPSWIGSGGL